MRFVAASAALAGSLLLPSAAWAGSPSEAYFAYHDAVLKAQLAEDLAAFVPKADRDKLKLAPLPAKQFFLQGHKNPAKDAIERPKVVKETISGDASELVLETVSDFTWADPKLGKRPAKGTVKLVKEADGWKIAEPPVWAMKEW
jgi:hypothetical protein